MFRTPFIAVALMSLTASPVQAQGSGSDAGLNPEGGSSAVAASDEMFVVGDGDNAVAGNDC